MFWRYYIPCFGDISFRDLAIFQLLIDLYPEYISGYNGMARTLPLKIDKEEAIKVYQHALKNEPNNKSIIGKLKNLTTE